LNPFVGYAVVPKSTAGASVAEIRNPNIEIRNNREIQISEFLKNSFGF